MSSKNIFSKAKFLVSAFSLKDLSKDTGIEVAFCGRSNSGKSSVLNAITENKKLAKTSKIPGRTQAINIFSLGVKTGYRIADLPGYGFAKVSKKTQKEWAYLINSYLSSRQSLRGLVIIVDIRHAFKDSDLSLINWSVETKTPILIALNKSDKLSKNKVTYELEKAYNQLKIINFNGKILTLSAKKSLGIKEFREELGGWFSD